MSKTNMRIIARVLLYWLAFIGLYRIGGSLSEILHANRSLSGLGSGMAGLFTSFLTTWVFLTWDRRDFASIGLVWTKATGVRVIKGFMLGTVLLLIMLVVILSYGKGTMQRISWNPDFHTFIALLTIISLAIMEEVAFRSYALIRLNHALGLRATLFIVAFVFALYHILMGWSIYMAFIGPFAWSFVFGLAALRSGGIAISCGIHIAANLLQNAFGLVTGNLTIYKLSFPESNQRRGEVAVLAVQIGLFVASLIAVEVFVRRDKRKNMHLKQQV